jgi:hypothetical protein
VVSGHTPGPWNVAENGTKLTAKHPLRGHQYDIVTVHYAFEHGQHEANATLIAAAPDLLEALEAISQSWGAHGTEVNNPMADAMAARARKALAKAGVQS